MDPLGYGYDRTNIWQTLAVVMGDHGRGELHLSGTTRVEGSELIAGAQSTGKGFIQVDGGHTDYETANLNFWRLVLGQSGAGTLFVGNQGDVNVTDSIILGQNAGSSGTLVISGKHVPEGMPSSSQPTLVGNMVVGAGGTGLAIIKDGGIFSGHATIGWGQGSQGKLIFSRGGDDGDHYFEIGREHARGEMWLLDHSDVTGAAAIDNPNGQITVTENSRWRGDIVGSGRVTISHGGVIEGQAELLNDGKLIMDADRGGATITSTASIEGNSQLFGAGDIHTLKVSGRTANLGGHHQAFNVDQMAIDQNGTVDIDLDAWIYTSEAVATPLTIANELNVPHGTLHASVGSAGYYRLFDYGSMQGSFDLDVDFDYAGGSFSSALDTSVPNTLHMTVLGEGQRMQFWSSQSGTVWSGSGLNWNENANEGTWGGSVGVFNEEGGAVIEVQGRQRFDTLQFAKNGYRLEGDVLQMAPAFGDAAVLNVDRGVTATIDSAIWTDTQSNLIKAGSGVLALGSDAHRLHYLTVTGGALAISRSSLGTLTALILDGGSLQVDGNTSRFDHALILGDHGGGFDIVNADNTFEVDASLVGAGGLIKWGEGTLRLSGDNRYTGGTFVHSGVLVGNAESLQGDIVTRPRWCSRSAAGHTKTATTVRSRALAASPFAALQRSRASIVIAVVLIWKPN